MSFQDNRTLRLAAQLEKIVAAERREAARAEMRAHKRAALDARILAACCEVGEAADRLAQMQFAGASEYQARVGLERAAKNLAKVLHAAGRMKGVA